MPLVRTGRSDDHDLGEPRSRLTELETALAERVAEIGRVKAELGTFTISYRRQVGLLHEELDDLERAIAEAELFQITRRLDEADARGREDEPPALSPSEPSPRYSTDAVRRLFRDVAKAIHPDLTQDELSRDRRHALMIEANRAYAMGDEQRLRSILQSWERSPEAVQGSDPEATRLRMMRRIDELEEQLAMCAADLDALRDTPMWKLKAMVDEAGSKGKDLVGDMVRRLKRDILAARNRLDAMQSMP